MEQRDGTIELLLRRWVAGGGKMHRAELFKLFTRCGVLMFLSHGAAGRQYQKPATMNNEDSRAQHGDLRIVDIVAPIRIAAIKGRIFGGPAGQSVQGDPPTEERLQMMK